jgi:hypothetical protein
VCEPGIGCALSQGVTEGGAACTTGTEHCESSDGFCMPAGPRPVVNGDAAPEVWTWPVAACEANQYQNGDLDYDGNSYWPDWPNGSTNLPTSFRYIGPFLANGQPYPKINFETDGPGSENDCNPAATTPTGAPNVTAIDKFCTVPPSGAKFYPFWSLSSREGIDGTNNISGECVWNFGNDIAGLTTQDFGGSSHNGQYGQPDVSRYAGTLITGGEPNPEVTGACAGLTLSKVLGSR